MDLGARAIIPMRIKPNPVVYPRRCGAPAVVYKQSQYPLPYFAHQQLDPTYFPQGEFAIHIRHRMRLNLSIDMGVPVGGPKGEEGDIAWDDDDSDNGADLESDADDMVPVVRHRYYDLLKLLANSQTGIHPQVESSSQVQIHW
jgi:hypothetical protein